MLSKETIDKYLQALSEKILDRFGEEAHIKIIIAGGAAIALNYTFRESTMDVDTYSAYARELDDLVGLVANEYGIESDWLSHNMMVTQSCSQSIVNYTKPYKVFSGVLDVHTVDSLTLICMKSVSCRPDSHDMEDIVNILDSEPSIGFTEIRQRFFNLYSDWSLMKADAQVYLTKRFNAMPPDMVDVMKDYLPPTIANSLSGEALYDACQEVYRRML